MIEILKDEGIRIHLVILEQKERWLERRRRFYIDMSYVVVSMYFYKIKKLEIYIEFVINAKCKK